jgi:polyisoprenoid-binding protein YceI
MQAVPTGPIEIDGIWQVTAGSEAGYRLGEVLSGQQAVVVGRTDEVSGTVEIVDGFMTAATITVQAGSISTDESARDAFFRRALDTTSFPTATFTLTEPVDVSAIGSSAAPMSVAAVGVLTLHGVGQPVTTTFDVQRTADGVEVAAQVPVTLADFDLEAPDLGWVVVEPTGAVEVLVRLGR